MDPPPPPTPTPHAWEWGRAPDMLLQQAKDDHLVGRIADDLRGIAARALGGARAERWGPELAALAAALYFGVTRLAGRQTLGEEYTDLQAVVAAAGSTGGGSSSSAARLGRVRLPSSRRLALFAALSVLAPYAYARLQRVVIAADQAAAAAAAAAAGLHANASATSAAAAAPPASTSSSPPNLSRRALNSLARALRAARSNAWALLAHCLSPTSRVAAAAALVYQAHRMLFFFRGDYASLPMRLAGLRHMFNRAFEEDRASYSVLGLLLLVRLALTTARQTYAGVRALAGPSFFVGGEAALGGKEAARLEALVPSGRGGGGGGGGGGGETVALPTTTSTVERGRALTCLLCTGPLKHPTLTPCGHLFCWDCVVPWCSKRSVCPLCRQPSLPQQLLAIHLSGEDDLAKLTLAEAEEKDAAEGVAPDEDEQGDGEGRPTSNP